MTYFYSLSAAGFAATAISYGPARMGFGLFVPEFRAEFALSTQSVGLISSLGFAGFFLGLVAAQLLLNRRGPERPVLWGLAAATAGLGLVAMAGNAVLLALGVFLAASSAGFAWTPFNDAVHRKVREADRSGALSGISTGTSVGIALAGAVALGMVLTGYGWRVCWGLFAAAALLALLANRRALHPVGISSETMPTRGWQSLMRRAALPLFVTAFVYGVTSAVFISFAGDRFASEAGLPGLPQGAAVALVFVVYGLFGLSGLATARLRRVLGLAWLVRGLMLCAALSLGVAALWPGGWAGLIVSAGAQGINVMMTSAVLALWSERLFPALPSFGFTAALLATAAGSVAGPALAGLVSTHAGAMAMFLGVAALPAAAAAGLLGRFVTDGPAGRRISAA